VHVLHCLIISELPLQISLTGITFVCPSQARTWNPISIWHGLNVFN